MTDQKDFLAEARAGLKEARQELTSATAAVVAAKAERDELQPKGWRGLLAGRADPELLAEQDALIASLVRARADALEELNSLNRMVEQMEAQQWSKEAPAAARPLEQPTPRPAHPTPSQHAPETSPPEVPLQLQEFASPVEELQKLLTRMRALAEQSKASKTLDRRTNILFRRHTIKGAARDLYKAGRDGSVLGEWHSLADRAEPLADQLGIPLAVPRIYTSQPHPTAQPTREIAMLRKGLVTVGNEQFFANLPMATVRIDQALRACMNGPGPVVPQAPEAPPASAEALLRKQFAELGSCFTMLMKLRAGRASTMQLLDEMGRWQRNASAVRESTLAVELDLLPPFNQGDPLDTFLERLSSEWPEVRDRFAAWEG